jgi:hypothetical protein
MKLAGPVSGSSYAVAMLDIRRPRDGGFERWDGGLERWDGGFERWDGGLERWDGGVER